MNKRYEELIIPKEYPRVELIEWEIFPDYIRISPLKQDEWYVYQFRYLKQYIHKVLKGWSVADFFPDIDPSEIAVYSNSIFTDEIATDLSRRTGRAIKASDKNAEEWINSDDCIEVLKPGKFLEEYKSRNIKKVIVCGIFYENEIMDELLDLGFELNDIVTLCNILVQ